MVFVSWGAVAGRSRELADALGGRAFALFPPREGRRLPAVVRYALSTVQTLAILARTDPRALIVTNPPIVLALLAAAWGGVRRIPFVLDSHPGSFGRQGDKVSARFVPLHRRLARRAAAVLVTDTAWAETVADWGGYGIVLHEAPGAWEPVPARPPGTPLTVLFVTRFAGDEPVAEGIAAAELVAGTEFLVTGRLDDLPDELRTAAPANVSFVGFLPFDRYRRLVEDADIVLALTTEPTSAMRSAYEAVYAGKPLVVSDFALDRELFPFAVHTANDATSIAAAVAVAATRLDELHGQAAEARRLQVDRFEAQLASLAAALDGDGP